MSARLKQIKKRDKAMLEGTKWKKDIEWLIKQTQQGKEEIEELQMHERNLEKAIDKIISTVEKFDEELAYDCRVIVDDCSCIK